MKKLPIAFAAITAIILMSTPSTYAADDGTFVGVTLGSKYEYPACGVSRVTICGRDRQTIDALSGGHVSQVNLQYQRGFVPDWLILNSTQVALRDGNIESILFAIDIPSSSIGQKGLRDIYQHLVEKLGPESKREKLDAYGQPYHYVATWNKPYGKVTFETAAQLSTSAVALPILTIQSNKWLELLDAEEKIRQQRKTEADAKRLKF